MAQTRKQPKQGNATVMTPRCGHTPQQITSFIFFFFSNFTLITEITLKVAAIYYFTK